MMWERDKTFSLRFYAGTQCLFRKETQAGPDDFDSKQCSRFKSDGCCPEFYSLNVTLEMALIIDDQQLLVNWQQLIQSG
jgi:hypothetical protein